MVCGEGDPTSREIEDGSAKSCLMLPVNTPTSPQRVMRSQLLTSESKLVPKKRTEKLKKATHDKKNVKEKSSKSSTTQRQPSTDETFYSRNLLNRLHRNVDRKKPRCLSQNLTKS